MQAHSATAHASSPTNNHQQTHNADRQELEKFSALAHTWWDQSGPFHPLHAINPLRLQWLKQYASIEQKKVLDVGCGGGILSEALAKQKADEVLGIDLAEKSLRVAQLHALESELDNLRYEHIAAEKLAQTHAQYFDVVCCMEMLEHVPNPYSIVQACTSMVKAGGWVFFSTINRSPAAFFQAILGAEYILNMLPKGTHEYEKFIRPSELAAMCESNGLELKGMSGLHYNPISKRYALSTNPNVNYFLATQKPV